MEMKKNSQLTDNEESEWPWTLYPPKLYFRNIPFVEKNVTIYVIGR